MIHNDKNAINEILKDYKTAEERFPVFIHSWVPREIRVNNLKEMSRKYKVFQDSDMKTKWIFDYEIAKRLFASSENAVRYTILMTDVDSELAKEVELIMNSFPVFADEENYEEVKSYGLQLKELTESRIANLDLEKYIYDFLRNYDNPDPNKIDFLKVLKLCNSSLAIKLLNLEGKVSPEELNTYSEEIFDLFSGQEIEILNEQEIKKIHETFSIFKDKSILERCFTVKDYDDPRLIGALSQWITGFLTPCITWVVYVFLSHFYNNIVNVTGNYEKPESRKRYKNFILQNYIPFQSINRIVASDICLEDIIFNKGEIISIIPDALYFSENGCTPAQVISSTIGAPDRPCMGMSISSKIVEAYENIFIEGGGLFQDYNIRYNFIPSSSSLVFSELNLSK